MSEGGFGALAQLQQIQAAQAASRGGGTKGAFGDLYRYEAKLFAGEKMCSRFLGGRNEPYQFFMHSLSELEDGFEKEPCAIPVDAGQNMPRCLCCEASAEAWAANKGKGKAERPPQKVGQRSHNAAFTIFSCREVLLIPKKRQDGTEYILRDPVHVNEQGHHLERRKQGEGQYAKWVVVVCDGGMRRDYHQYPRELEGLKMWIGGVHPKGNNVHNLITEEGKLRRRCQCGRTFGSGFNASVAEIFTQGYSCCECGEAAAYDPNSGTTFVCQACGESGKPDEALGCTANCGAPRRMGLDQCYVDIIRHGAGKDETSYSFIPRAPSAPDPTHKEAMYELKNGVWSGRYFDYKSFFTGDLNRQYHALQKRGVVLRSPFIPAQGVDPAAGPPPTATGSNTAPPPRTVW